MAQRAASHSTESPPNLAAEHPMLPWLAEEHRVLAEVNQLRLLKEHLQLRRELHDLRLTLRDQVSDQPLPRHGPNTPYEQRRGQSAAFSPSIRRPIGKDGLSHPALRDGGTGLHHVRSTGSPSCDAELSENQQGSARMLEMRAEPEGGQGQSLAGKAPFQNFRALHLRRDHRECHSDGILGRHGRSESPPPYTTSRAATQRTFRETPRASLRCDRVLPQMTATRTSREAEQGVCRAEEDRARCNAADSRSSSATTTGHSSTGLADDIYSHRPSTALSLPYTDSSGGIDNGGIDSLDCTSRCATVNKAVFTEKLGPDGHHGQVYVQARRESVSVVKTAKRHRGQMIADTLEEDASLWDELEPGLRNVGPLRTGANLQSLGGGLFPLRWGLKREGESSRASAIGHCRARKKSRHRKDQCETSGETAAADTAGAASSPSAFHHGKNDPRSQSCALDTSDSVEAIPTDSSRSIREIDNSNAHVESDAAPLAETQHGHDMNAFLQTGRTKKLPIAYERLGTCSESVGTVTSPQDGAKCEVPAAYLPAERSSRLPADLQEQSSTTSGK